MQVCNINYTHSDGLDMLEYTVSDLWGRKISRDEIVAQVLEDFGKSGNTLVSINEVTDKGSRDFIEDLTQIICRYDKHSPELLSSDAKTLRNNILSAFFLENLALDSVVQEKDINDAGNTDENQLAEKEKDLQEALDSIYGGNVVGLSNNLQSSFIDELSRLLIYNPDRNVTYHFNEFEVNKRITTYKRKKFLAILNFLKNKYPQDKRLKEIKDLYTYVRDGNKSVGYINGLSYNYVMNLFENYIKEYDGLSDVLNSELNDIILQKYLSQQTEKYKELIETVVLEDPDLREWFRKRFKTEHERTNAETTLFLGNQFNIYYNLVKEKIDLELEKNPNQPYKDKALSLIRSIENPKNSLLSYIDDFIKLKYFDDLLGVGMNEYLSFDRKMYQKNNQTTSTNILKYNIKLSKKHLNAGWETTNKDDAARHTSETIKNIINKYIPIYSYIDGGYTGRNMDINSLMLAWQALLLDIYNNNINFLTTSEKVEDVINQFKEKASTLNHNTVDTISELLSLLFDSNERSKNSPWAFPAVNILTGLKNLTKDLLHILYSFYHKVLDKNNPYSIISTELADLNAGRPSYDGEYLPNTTGLVSVLYRNVSNSFLECNLTNKARGIDIKTKFSWNSELFDMIEACDFASKMRQHTKIGLSAGIEKYNYKITPNEVKREIHTITLKNTEGEDVELGFVCTDNKFHMFAPTESNVRLTGDSNNILTRLCKLDLDKIKAKLLSDDAELTDDEFLLKQMLEFIDQYLKLGLLSETGLNTLSYYKNDYSKFYREDGMVPNLYLEHLFKLAMRTIDVDNEALIASEKGISLKKYIEDKYSQYSAAYNAYNEDFNSRRMFSIEGTTKVFLVPIDRFDKSYDRLAKYRMIAKGRSTRSTSLNKAGAAVSNYSISRAGSELALKLHEQATFEPKNGDKNVYQNLIFVLNRNALQTEPVIDGEVTTLSGDVKSVKEMSTSELFLHAILDKFYLSYVKKKKICFLPTVYSDKTQFLNWLASISDLDPNNSVMDLSRDDVESLLQDRYISSFFAAHDDIKLNIINKYSRLYSEQFLALGINLEDITIDNVRDILKTKTYDLLREDLIAYNELNPDNQIELELDKDYRVNKETKKCDINEIIQFYSNLFHDKKKVKRFFDLQKKIFLDNLKENDVSFKLFNSKDEMDAWIKEKPRLDKKDNSDILEKKRRSNYLLELLSLTEFLGYNYREQFVRDWVNKETGEFILQNEEGKLNPFLERFFYIEGLYSNNLRLSLTGTEGNHPDKANTLMKSKEFNELVMNILNNPRDFKSLEDLTKLLEDNGIKARSTKDSNNPANEYKKVLDFIEMFRGVKSTKELSVVDLLNGNEIAQQLYDKDIVTIINTAQGTQFKRNVIVTATSQHPTPGKIDGVADEVLACVIEDMKAHVNNLRESDKIDSQDGSAKVSPILVILENSSLGDLKVGTNRKPIWDDLTSDLTSFLAKFAAFSDTNATMSNYTESKSSPYMMFKKMHHIRWDGEIDLTHSILKARTVAFNLNELNKWFTGTILEGEQLYYNNEFGEIIEITGFGKEKGIYYTIEKARKGESVKVYHYFNDNGDHFKSDKLARPNKDGVILLDTAIDDNNEPIPLHTIDSLYELHKAIGGINSCNKDGVSSEFSLKVLTNFVNNVGFKKRPVAINSAYDVEQPLKSKFIAYAFNSTAVKNGAKNVNRAEGWTDENYKLSTFKLRTKGLGIQLNADHDATDAELTEFSQVVAACAAYGKNYSTINEIYYGLAESAFQASKDELDSIDEFLNSAVNPEEAKYKLYKIVAKLILKSRSNSNLDLTERLKYELNQSFKIDKDGVSSELKVPFSDPSIYSRFITSITSVINQKSIKRKHPGSGYVMAPGYNQIQYYQIPDSKNGGYRKYMFNDVLKKARNEYRLNLINVIKSLNGGNNIILFNGDKNFNFEKARLDLLVKILRQLTAENPLENIVTEDPQLNSDLQKVIKYNKLSNKDVLEFNRALVREYIAQQLDKEELRSKEWFMPTDNVDILDLQGNVIKSGVSLDSMEDFYKFKDGIKQAEAAYNVTINRTIYELKDKTKIRKFRISLNEDISGEGKEFILEQAGEGQNLYNIHFRTGADPSESTYMRRGKSTLTPEQRNRLFKAALEVLPMEAEIQISNTTKEQLKSGLGGLGEGSISGFLSISPEAENKELMLERVGNTILEVVPNSERIISYFEQVKNEDGSPQINPKTNLPRYLVARKSIYRYKKTGQSAAYNYRLNISSPVNLKPSLVRWLYVDSHGQTRFMTIYDHPIIKNSWNLDKNQRPTQKQIQEVLDNLKKGFFEMDGVRYDIVPNSFENTEAEIVLGNMYKRIFGIGNESLAEIMEQGEDYFKKKAEGTIIPKTPKGFYDLAFTRNNGNHVLISLGTVNTGFGIIELPYDRSEEKVDKDTFEIHHKKVKVGKYIEAKDWTYHEEEDGRKYVTDRNGDIIDESQYKVVDIDSGSPRVLKRIDFVKRYVQEKVDVVNGVEQTQKYILYQIADKDVIKAALDNVIVRENGKKEVLTDEQMDTAAFNLISRILKTIYDLNNFTDVKINTGVIRKLDDDNTSRKFDNVKTRRYIASCLGKEFGNRYRYDQKTKKFVELTEEEIGKLSKFDRHMIKVKDLLQNDVIKNEDGTELKINFTEKYDEELSNYHNSIQHYKKLWVSFINSLHFISSRIPAQSLQSFMPMTCVGWTNDQSNTAYVSYIQTYLQGSDYDIDKAYVMGQSFTDDGEYIRWSNLFDFSSYETLAVSKTLPVPRGYTLKVVDERYDITNELNAIYDAELSGDKVKALEGYVELIRKIDNFKGKYWHTNAKDGRNPLIMKEILKKVQDHEKYEMPEQLRESGFKNVASANIWYNVHDIRNRDQAYSPITMRDLQNAAEHTPKGEKTKTLNMFNPLTKYVMLNQNLVGKDVIGIAANGEKDWFNLTYYYHNLLRTGDSSDLFFIKMQHNYKRILGRAAWKMPKEGKTVKHIPDLWLADGTFDRNKADSQIAAKLKEVFYTDEEFKSVDIEDKYVDQLISQLLSAATDNAKELILARINSGTNLAKYYLHLIMMGFSLNDVVAFMTSPVIELIDKYSRSNFYNYKISNVKNAIKVLRGDINLRQHLVKPIDPKITDPDELDEITDALFENALAAQESIEDEIELRLEEAEDGISTTESSKEYDWVTEELKRKDGTSIYDGIFSNLEEFIKYYIHSKVASLEEIDNNYKLKLLKDYNLPVTDNFNTNQFFNYVNDIVNNMNNVIDEYNSKHKGHKYTLEDLKLDLDEFTRLDDEANETSTLASVWLKLNQGIPQTDIDLIKLIKKMNDSVSTREHKFKIRKNKDVLKKSYITLADEDDVLNDENNNSIDQSKKESVLILASFKMGIDSIMNDETIGENSKDIQIRKFLDSISDNSLKKLRDVVTSIKDNNMMLTYDEIVCILIDAVDANLFGNFDIYKYLSNENVQLQEHKYELSNGETVSFRYNGYKDKDGEILKGDTISYRELAARYYNLIKSSWNILDIVRRIHHYNMNLNLLNYTLLTRQLFPNKSKIIDKLIGLGDLSYQTLTDKDYKRVVEYADRILNTSFFFQLEDEIDLSKCIEDSDSHPLVYNTQYALIPSYTLNLNNLNGIDSLKHFVENEFLNWLKKNYADNPLVKDLDLRSNRGKSILRTRLELDQIDASLANQKTYNDYLIGINQLSKVKFDDNYTVADILALYNLAVNGTKLGGRYLTAIFRDLVKKDPKESKGTVLYEYYKYIGNADYNQINTTVHPTKRDFLIYLAPTVYSREAVDFRTEKYVKLFNPTRGFDLFERKFNPKTKQNTYKELDLNRILELESMLSPDVIDERIYEFTSNSLTTFPELHRRLTTSTIWLGSNENSINELLEMLLNYVKSGKVLIYKNCDGV